MKTSENIQELATALLTFHSKVGKIKKDAKNPFFKSNYASLSHILEEIAEPLQDAGLVITQFPDASGLTTILLHAKSGQYMQATYEMPVAKANDPQALGSAISYARRYAVSSILSLQIDDDDAERAMKEVRNPELPWLNKGAQLDKALEYVRTGGNIATIESKYRISKEIREALNKAKQQ